VRLGFIKAPSISGHVRLVQRKRGPVFYAKWRSADGRHPQRLLGPAHLARSKPPAGHLTRGQAEALLDGILADEREQVALPASTLSVTFGEAIAEWLRYVEHDCERAPSTLRDYRNTAAMLKDEFGPDTPLRSITTADVDAFRERSLAGKVSRRTVQKWLVILHGILNRATRKGWIVHNPATDAERVRVNRSGDFNVLEPQDVLLVAGHAASEDAAIYTTAAFTGLRMGELRALRWRDVDFTLHLVHVRRNLPTGGIEREPKSGKVRSVPLIDQAARVLDGLSRREHFTGPDDRVFVNTTGGPVDDVRLRRRFYAALTSAGFGDLRSPERGQRFRVHDLRHTFGTMAVQAFPLSDVQAYMGHATSRPPCYVHHVPQHDAADRLTALGAGDETMPPTVPRTAELEGPPE
jgi:integrase